MKSLLFLDCDGCIVPFGGLYASKDHYKIPNDIVLRMKRIISETGCSIVFETHRIDTFQMCRDMCLDHGIPDVFVGKTTLNDDSWDKGKEIDNWMIDNMKIKIPYVIIDDLPSSEFLPHQRSRHVRPMSEIGIDDECVLKAIEILKK